jgi:hypothetical protein
MSQNSYLDRAMKSIRTISDLKVGKGKTKNVESTTSENSEDQDKILTNFYQS